MAGDTCDVCGSRDDKIMVYSSSLGPMSNAYCQKCADKGAEPYYMLKGFVDGTILDNPADWVFKTTTWKDGKYITGQDIKDELNESRRNT